MEALVVRDFYHRYTVDEHTLVAITAVLNLRGMKGDPFAELAAEAPDFDLLILALLFHDVGKGTPDTGHVEASAKVAGPALRRVGISDRAWGIVEFLILAHLELSAAMSSRDLSDPNVIRSLAEKMGTVEKLKLLTLLTWADISAVNPTAMTPWRRQMLWKLYLLLNAELTRELTVRMAPPEAQGSPEMREFLEGLPPPLPANSQPGRDSGTPAPRKRSQERRKRQRRCCLAQSQRGLDIERRRQRPSVSFRVGGCGDFEFWI